MDDFNFDLPEWNFSLSGGDLTSVGSSSLDFSTADTFTSSTPATDFGLPNVTLSSIFNPIMSAAGQVVTLKNAITAGETQSKVLEVQGQTELAKAQAQLRAAQSGGLSQTAANFQAGKYNTIMLILAGAGTLFAFLQYAKGRK